MLRFALQFAGKLRGMFFSSVKRIGVRPSEMSFSASERSIHECHRALRRKLSSLITALQNLSSYHSSLFWQACNFLHQIIQMAQ